MSEVGTCPNRGAKGEWIPRTQLEIGDREVARGVGRWDEPHSSPSSTSKSRFPTGPFLRTTGQVVQEPTTILTEQTSPQKRLCPMV